MFGPARYGSLKPQLFFHLPAHLFRLFPVMPRPDRPASHKADPVPDNVKMLPPVLDMLDNDTLVMEHFVAVFFLASLDNG